MSIFHYALGLDIGTESVGWAILRNNAEGEPIRIQDLGVRVFDKAELPKTGKSFAVSRREARNTRRRLRRHHHRLERIRYLLEQYGIMSRIEIAGLYAKGSFTTSPYQLRVEALDRPLTREETVRVFIHLAQRRGYKSNSIAEDAKGEKDTGKIKTAIAENNACMMKHGYRTVGEMMYKDQRYWQKNPDGTRYHQTRNKPGDYRFIVERASVVEEIRKIFDAQRRFKVSWMTEELEQTYLAIFESQRSFDEGPGGSSPFSGRIAEKVGKCAFEPEEPRAAKATYTFEYFRLLQDLNHLRLIEKGLPPRTLDDKQRETLKNAAMQSSSLSFGQLRKLLALNGDTYFNNLSYDDKSQEEAEKKTWPQMQAYHKLRVLLNKVSKNAIQALTVQQLNEIGTILTIYKNDDSRIAALREAGIPEIYDEALLPLSFSKFGHLSVKAMEKLIPFLEQGLRYDEAYAVVYGTGRVTPTIQRGNRLSLSDMEDIPNPVMRRAAAQTIKVINAVVRTYGPPDVVRIKLGWELACKFDERRKAEKKQAENQAANEQIQDQIRQYKSDPVTGLDILKFKLFKEQNGICLYSGKELNMNQLFEPGYVSIDHIIPYSRSFDDSYQNKVLVLTSENIQKGNCLPYEYFGQNETRWASFEARAENLIHDYRKRQKLLKKGLTEEESKNLFKQNLNDQLTFSRGIGNLIQNHLIFADSRYERHPVQTVNEAVITMLKGRWSIRKMEVGSDLDHCLDAVVVASVSPGLIRRLKKASADREMFKTIRGEYLDVSTGELLTQQEYYEKYEIRFPTPWPRFRQELNAKIDPVNPRHAIDALKLETYESEENIKPVFVSRTPNHKVTGPAHEETIRGRKMGNGYAVVKTPLSKLKLNKSGEIEGYYNPESDKLLYDALLAQLTVFGGDGNKAFAQPFYKPKRDGTPGPRVDKVKIFEKTTLNLPVREGVAANGSMVRIDVFYVANDGYYFVPIYVADTKKPVLPNRAVVAYKPYSEWQVMDDQDFLFSLYPGDLVRIQSQKDMKLKLEKGCTGENEVFRKDGMYYYLGASISVGAIRIETHDRRYSQSSLGLKTLQSIEKYQVDILGHYHKVHLPEKRMTFTKEV